MMVIIWGLLRVCLCSSIGDQVQRIKDNRVFLKHNDLYVPLKPVLWGKLMGEQKMLLAFQHKGDQASLMSTLGKMDEAYPFYLVDRRGLLRYDPELVTSIDQEDLQFKDDAALIGQYQKLAVVLGMPNGLDQPYEQLVLLDALRASDVELLPVRFWKTLTRAQFAEVSKKASLAATLNRLQALGLEKLAEGYTWRRREGKKKMESLLLVDGAPLTRDLEAVHWTALSGETLRAFGKSLVSSLDVYGILRELDFDGMLKLGRMYGGMPDEDEMTVKRLSVAWPVIFKFCPVFADVPLRILGLPKLVPALSIPGLSGQERLETFLFVTSEIAFKDPGDGTFVHDNVKRYAAELASKDELKMLQFLGKIRNQGVNISGLPLDASNWTAEHWTEVAKLPSVPEYFDLLILGFLKGEIPESKLPKVAPGINTTLEWRTFKAAKTKKLEKKFLQSHVVMLGKALLYLVNADPVKTGLPSALLKVIGESSGLEESIRTALLVHAHRQGTTLSEFSRPLKTIRPDSIFFKLPLDKLKLYLAAGPVDAYTVLLPDRDRLLVTSKTDRCKFDVKLPVLKEICQLVLSDKYDPEDLELLVTLLEANWQHIDLDILQKIHKKLILLDATEVNRNPSPVALNRLALVMLSREPLKDPNSPVSLDEVTRDIPHHFPSARFISGASTLNVNEAVEAFVWQTEGSAVTCAALVQMMSYLYGERPLSDEVMSSVQWTLDGLGDVNLINLLGRIYKSQAQLTHAILKRLGDLGFPSEGFVHPDPMEGFLDAQQDQAALQQVLLEWEDSEQAKAGTFPLDPFPLLERFFQLGNVELRTMRANWSKAYDLAGTYRLAFKLLTLIQTFKNTPLQVLLEILAEAEGNISKTAKTIKETIVDP